MQVNVEHQKAIALPRGKEKKQKKPTPNSHFASRSFQEKKQKLQLYFTKHT